MESQPPAPADLAHGAAPRASRIYPSHLERAHHHLPGDHSGPEDGGRA